MDAKQKKEIEADIFKTLRSLSAILSVYVLGWFGFHWVWVFGSFIVYAYWKKTNRHNEKKDLFKTVVNNEQEALLKYKDLPSWVCFPDVQRAEWLNRVINQMWPFISDMISKILKEDVEPEIKKHMPFILKSFHFIEVDLGHQPLRIGGIKVYTEHIKPNEIIIDAEIIYAGDAVVKVGFSPGITAGISDLQVRGTMRIEMSPILPQPPLIGAVTIYFLENPEFDFDLTNLLNLLDVPGLSSIFKSAIEQVIESFIVLPKRVTIPIASPEDLQSLKYPMPLGVLQVKILEASGLKARDRNLFKKDTSDPYVNVKVGKFKYKTRVIQKTIAPKWKDEIFMVFIHRVVGTKIHFEVMDKDNTSDADSLGYAEQSLEALVHDGKKKDYTLPLDEGKGSLHCQLEWFKFTDNYADVKPLIEVGPSSKTPEATGLPLIEDGLSSKTCLFVKLLHATGLPAVNMDKGTCSSHVEITVGDKTVKSKTKRNTKKPIWDELHSFFVHDLKEEVVKFRVLEAENDEVLGKLEVKVSKLFNEPSMKLAYNFSLDDCFTDGYLSVVLELKGLVSSICDETQST